MYINRYVYSVFDMYRHAEPDLIQTVRPIRPCLTNLSTADLSGP